MPVLHMLCGKIAAGKTTLAARLTREPATVLVAEDAWLKLLYPDEIRTVPDYLARSARLREAMGAHVQDLLRAGVSVVLDFQANTVGSRQWLRSLFVDTGADHVLHFLDVPDELCKQRLKARNLSGSHEFAPTDAEFDLLTSYFVPPAEGEGFKVLIHRPD